MTTRLRFTWIVTALLALFIVFPALAKPMDAGLAEKYVPRLRSISDDIRKGNLVTSESKLLLRECLKSKDPVLVSVGSWCVSQLGEQGDDLYSAIPDASVKMGDIAEAFVTLARASKHLRTLSPVEKKEYYISLSKSTNVFLKIESAKALAKIDKAAGKSLLVQFGKSKNSTESEDAKRALQRMELAEGESAAQPSPYFDETSAMIASIIEGPTGVGSSSGNRDK